MDNVLVRKALSAAIDRQSLADNVLKGGQIPANTFAPSMIFGNAAEDPDIAPWALTEEQGGTGYAAAVEQAKAWLAEAGYPDGEGFPAITLMHNTSEAHAQIAQAVQAMWKEALNIEVNVENQEWRVYLDTIRNQTPLEQRPHVVPPRLVRGLPGSEQLGARSLQHRRGRQQLQLGSGRQRAAWAPTARASTS